MDVAVFGATLELDAGLVDAPGASDREQAREAVPERTGDRAAVRAAVRRQVREYERGERRDFDLDVTPPDSFTGEVMAAMCEIPYGETRTYGDLADRLDTAPVAVGGACGRNPVPLVVPCHRVVAADGSLRGYSADGGVETKRRLLAHEREQVGGDGAGGSP